MTDLFRLHAERAAIVDALAEMSDDDPELPATLDRFRRLTRQLARPLDLDAADGCAVD